jgi:hypothetical protein
VDKKDTAPKLDSREVARYLIALGGTMPKAKAGRRRRSPVQPPKSSPVLRGE